MTVRPVDTPTKGSAVAGHVYIDKFNSTTDSGDELIGLPYSYQIG